MRSEPLCTTSFFILQTLQPSIQEQDDNLKELVGHDRIKRSLFDAGGKLFKMLIGTLDEDDADFYNSKINDLITGEKDFTDLLKSQTQVVQSTIINFNNTLTNIHHMEETFNSNIYAIQNFTKKVNNTLQRQSLKQNIQDHISLLLLIFTELNREYSIAINSVLLAKQNLLHPSILNPHRIITELSKTKKYLPSNTNYPVALNKANSHVLLKLISLVVYYTESKLIFLIYVPITENTIFNLFHLTPLPMSIGNNTYLFIKPNFDYITMTSTKRMYTPLNSLIDCKRSYNNTYICSRQTPLFNTYSKGICESELLVSHTSLPKVCDSRISILTNELWYQLNEKNKWLYVVPETVHVTIDCQRKGIFDIQIVDTGFLILSTHCDAYTKSVTLTPSQESSSSITSFLPDFDIISGTDKAKILKIDVLNLTPIQTPVMDLNDLKLASFKLDQISQLADQISSKSETVNRLQQHGFLITIISIISTFFILYYIVKCLCNCKKILRQTNPCPQLLMLTHSNPRNPDGIEMQDTMHEPSEPNMTNETCSLPESVSPKPSSSRRVLRPRLREKL